MIEVLAVRPCLHTRGIWVNLGRTIPYRDKQSPRTTEADPNRPSRELRCTILGWSNPRGIFVSVRG